MSGSGLNVQDVVNVNMIMSPTAVPLRNFGTLCIAGPSDVIDVKERIREYTGLTPIANDFGVDAPEYLAADIFFSQNPQPSIVYIGRFAQTATSAVLHGAIMSPLQQANLLTKLTPITNGSLQITVDGTPRTVSASSATLTGGAFTTADQATLLTTLQGITAGAFGITIDGTLEQVGPVDFATAESLTDCATLITTAMGAHGSCTWNTVLGAFVVKSGSTGTTSTITYAEAPTADTDISADLQLTAATGAQAPINGSSGLNFTGITNLNGAAAIIDAALVGATCWFDGTQFHVESYSTGAASTITYASSAGVGTDISAMLGLTQASGASVPVNGIAAETAVQCAAVLRQNPSWYGLQYATTTPIADSDLIAVAAFIEGCSPISIFGYTTQETDVLDPTVTTDIMSQMMGEGFSRTFGQYSSSPYAACSAFGRAFTVNFQGSNTVITLKFKQEPGVTGEQLTETQAATLKAKNGNVFVYYSTGVAIMQEGVMANGYFFDERHGMDWQANQIQTDLFNALYTAPTKIPQTDPGVNVLVTTVDNSLAQGVTNGLVAPGIWNAPGFGSISTGQMLPKGYYVYAPQVASQDQADRDARIAPDIQAAMKLAGAIHFANVIVNVNR
jgi:hypothetical protein